ncbi:uncharacterized protein LOC115383708 [Salarias fasciatus]|uniref:uncharacterized protein LOC115383708 n=1 Tax=Salarias fasciatus TaxID=181472 RepID=UPI00117693DC|nr:uncharacterized protein LOC115383708 [Salarias fasciatus]
MKRAALICEHLNCGSVVSVQPTDVSVQSMWGIHSGCFQSGSDLLNCVKSWSSSRILNLTCSDLLLHPVLSVSSSSSILGVSEAQQQGLQVVWGSTFTISCSIQPQYPGGSFQLTFTSSNTSYKSTQPAVNHSAHFLFPAAEPAHRGNYSCVYHLHVFGHDFWSESRLLSLSVSGKKKLTPPLLHPSREHVWVFPPLEVQQAGPTGRRPRGGPGLSGLVWERLGVQPEELEEDGRDRHVWRGLVSVAPPRPDPDQEGAQMEDSDGLTPSSPQTDADCSLCVQIQQLWWSDGWWCRCLCCCCRGRCGCTIRPAGGRPADRADSERSAVEG